MTIDVYEKNYWYYKCRPLIASLHTLKSFQSKKTPCLRRLIVKLRTLFKTQDLENHTLFSGTYLHKTKYGSGPLGIALSSG